MSIFFLNSANRVYNDKELNAISKLLFSNGIFNTTQATRALWKLSGDFLVEPAGGTMSVTAKPGMASVAVSSSVGESVATTQQALIQEDNELSANVASNPSLANRNDAVVLRIDQSIIDDDDLNVSGSNAVSLVVISGNSANVLTDNEIAVALGGDPYIRLANILVPQNATEITAGMITDARELSSMTRSLSVGSDTIQFFSLANDPEDLETGMVWYNSTEDILKFYNGVNTIALQTQDFDWGYYPPNGIDQNIEDFDPIEENTGESGVSYYQMYKVIDLDDTPTNFTLMAGQIFEMPAISNPFIRVKMGNPTYPCGVTFEIYTKDGSDDPDTLVETVLSLSASDVPKNDYVSFYLDGTLYTPGTQYVLVVKSNQTGFVNSSNDADFVTNAVQFSSFSDNEYLIGSMQGVLSGSTTTDPTACTWNAPSTGSHFIMSIAERDEYAIGETDATGNAFLVSQAFIPKSRDILGFQVTKGNDIGSPTGDITASLYLADANNEPTGDVITSGIIAEADWATGTTGEDKVFPLQYDELVIGQKYVVVFDTDIHDNDNAYTMYFGSTSSGTAKINNTSDGWVSLNGDFFHAILVSSIRKIVVTNNLGQIDDELIPTIAKRVTSIVSSATPGFSVETADAVSITALAEAITSMTTNMIGTPTNFQRLVFRIKDNGTSRAITWGANFANKGATMPTATTLGKLHTVTFEYDSVAAVWGCISAVVEA